MNFNENDLWRGKSDLLKLSLTLKTKSCLDEHSYEHSYKHLYEHLDQYLHKESYKHFFEQSDENWYEHQYEYFIWPSWSKKQKSKSKKAKSKKQKAKKANAKAKSKKFNTWFKVNSKLGKIRSKQPKLCNVSSRTKRFKSSPISFMTSILNKDAKWNPFFPMNTPWEKTYDFLPWIIGHDGTCLEDNCMIVAVFSVMSHIMC